MAAGPARYLALLGFGEVAEVLKPAGKEAAQGDRALDWLERAWAERDPMLVYLRVDWDWKPLRSESRFQDLLRRMELAG